MNDLLFHLHGHVAAEGLLLHIVAVNCVGPGAASAADVYVLAGAALALVTLEVPQVPEKL